MSDFLTNLVGRSLGTLEVVRPRVPSIYEPYRRGSGLLGANPGLPARDIESEPPVETGLESGPNPIPSSQTPKLRTRPPHPPAHDAQQANNDTQAEAVKVSERPDPLPPSPTPCAIAPPEPIAAMQVSSRHDLASPSTATPISAPAGFELSLSEPRAHPDGTSLIAPPLGDMLGNTAEGNPPLAQSPVLTKPGPLRRLRPPEMKAEAFSSRLSLDKPEAPRATLEPSLIAHQASPAASALRPPIAPSAAGHQSHP